MTEFLDLSLVAVLYVGLHTVLPLVSYLYFVVLFPVWPCCLLPALFHPCLITYVLLLCPVVPQPIPVLIVVWVHLCLVSPCLYVYPVVLSYLVRSLLFSHQCVCACSCEFDIKFSCIGVLLPPPVCLRLGPKTPCHVLVTVSMYIRYLKYFFMFFKIRKKKAKKFKQKG